MKKLIGLLVIICMMSMSCERRYKTEPQVVVEVVEDKIPASDVVKITTVVRMHIKEMHGCEYVVVTGPSSVGVIHHAACKNKINHSTL